MTIIEFVSKFVNCILGLLTLGLLAYFIFFVSLGKKTLYQHIVGISKTEEAKVLGNELGKKVEHTTKSIAHAFREKVPKIVGAVSRPDSKDGGVEEHSKEDRKALERLIRGKSETPTQDREALKELIHKKNK